MENKRITKTHHAYDCRCKIYVEFEKTSIIWRSTFKASLSESFCFRSAKFWTLAVKPGALMRTTKKLHVEWYRDDVFGLFVFHSEQSLLHTTCRMILKMIFWRSNVKKIISFKTYAKFTTRNMCVMLSCDYLVFHVGIAISAHYMQNDSESDALKVERQIILVFSNST